MNKVPKKELCFCFNYLNKITKTFTTEKVRAKREIGVIKRRTSSFSPEWSKQDRYAGMEWTLFELREARRVEFKCRNGLGKSERVGSSRHGLGRNGICNG